MTWQTVSSSIEPPLELPNLDLELQDWCTKILEYLDRDELDIAPLSEDTQDMQRRETSWVTDTQGSLPYFHSLDWRQEQLPTRSLSLRGKGVKQERRNATVFALPKASLADLRESSVEYTHDTSTRPGSSRSNLQVECNNMPTPGTSGDHGESPEITRSQRIAPHHHPETLRILEGNGPFVLDGRDISRSQFLGRPCDSEDTITLGSSIQLQSILGQNMVDGNATEGQVHPWTSGVFNQHANEIVTSLRTMKGAAAAGPSEELSSPGMIASAAAMGAREDRLSPEEMESNIISLLNNMGAVRSNNLDRGQETCAPPEVQSVISEVRSSPTVGPLLSLPLVAPKNTASKKKHFGKLGRWWKRMVTR
ncbi:hypothetical protein PMIN05_006815 [Paraphaeosphaeria minitans]